MSVTVGSVHLSLHRSTPAFYGAGTFVGGLAMMRMARSATSYIVRGYVLRSVSTLDASWTVPCHAPCAWRSVDGHVGMQESVTSHVGFLVEGMRRTSHVTELLQ
jgi:hypothetical protein